MSAKLNVNMVFYLLCNSKCNHFPSELSLVFVLDKSHIWKYSQISLNHHAYTCNLCTLDLYLLFRQFLFLLIHIFLNFINIWHFFSLFSKLSERKHYLSICFHPIVSLIYNLLRFFKSVSQITALQWDAMDSRHKILILESVLFLFHLPSCWM